MNTNFKVIGLTRLGIKAKSTIEEADALYHSAIWASSQGRLQNFWYFAFCGIFILLSRESDQCAIRHRLEVASHLSTILKWGNPAKCLSQLTTSKLAGLFFPLSLLWWASSRIAVNTNFKVIGLTRLGIKPKSTAPKADALTTRPFELLKGKLAA